MTDRQGLAALLSLSMLVSIVATAGIVLWTCKTPKRVEVKLVKADVRPLKARHRPAGVKSPPLVKTTRIMPDGSSVPLWIDGFPAEKVENAFKVPGVILPIGKLPPGFKVPIL